MFKFAKKCFYKYSELLEKKPIQTKVATQCTLFVVGDGLAQKFALQQDIDYQKLAGGTLVSSMIAWMGHHWYIRLQGLISSGKLIAQGSSRMKQALTSLSIDQSFFGPLTNSLFLVGVAYYMERNAQKAYNNWAEKIEMTQKTSYKLWPAAQMINYYFVPVQFRMLYVNLVGVGWNSLRCVILSQERNGQELDLKGIEDGILSDHKQIYHEQEDLMSPLEIMMNNIKARINHSWEDYIHNFERNVYMMQGVCA
ncbi:hypothetical protein PPERSA_03565 [Pseudocohnilembus persalinus]|uniref:Mpv17/PMP22 n=1 Tax=Pseudocohnilembus persalinus TaxID=266149 RepID=A0A0V0QQU2_PSEPJ|nr:hypothetical protein PPERSA_03565 [Pseudocohnilembus persalinus]|eukprot:KRX04325.1 hypothetical protein PPERSA_03565 [Pseudocohnilembus persalinus]